MTHEPTLEEIAATWDLPSWCTCPNDCDCDGRLVCTRCNGRTHREGQEGHAELPESLAAKKRLRECAPDSPHAQPCYPPVQSPGGAA